MRLHVKLNTTDLYQSHYHTFIAQLKIINEIVSIKSFPQLKSSVALLHYQISVYGIYIERLLNHHWKLTSTNIDIDLDEMVSYFDKWLNERLSVKAKEKIWREK